MKNSIKQVYLWGGLGNVLYQINLAYYLHEKGYTVFVNKGLLNFNNKFLRNIIKIHKGVFERVDLFIDLNKINVVNKLNYKDIINFILYKLGFNTNSFKFFNHDWPKDYELSKVNSFLGYFQKTKIISMDLGIIFKTNFKSILNKELLFKVNQDSTILIHARFGDKVGVKEFDINYLYVLNVINNFKTVVIVTDDVNQAKLLNFNNKIELIVVCSEDIIEDFNLISCAKTVIITRSSFSWWATEISSKEQKIFQPEPFYNHVEWELFSNKIRVGYES